MLMSQTCKYLIYVILLEETHTSNEDQLQARGHIPGFILANATYNHRYGLETYVRKTITDWKLVDTRNTRHFNQLN